MNLFLAIAKIRAFLGLFHEKPINAAHQRICVKHIVLPTKLQIIGMKTFIFAENGYRNT